MFDKVSLASVKSLAAVKSLASVGRTSVAAIAVALLAAAGAEAQEPVKWSVAFDKKKVKSVAPGEKVKVVLKAKIDPGWYIYSLTQGEGGPVPSKVTLAKEQPFSLGDSAVKAAKKPKVKFDENFGITVEYHEVEAVFNVMVDVSDEADAKVKEIKIRARYQACTATVCLPPQTEKISLPVTVKRKAEGKPGQPGRKGEKKRPPPLEVPKPRPVKATPK